VSKLINLARIEIALYTAFISISTLYMLNKFRKHFVHYVMDHT